MGDVKPKFCIFGSIFFTQEQEAEIYVGSLGHFPSLPPSLHDATVFSTYISQCNFYEQITLQKLLLMFVV